MIEDATILELERRFLPALRAAAAEINAGFADVRAGTWSQPHGQATDSPGHVIALSCDVPDQDHRAEVTLELCFGALHGPSPSVEAHVIWDYPGEVETDLFPDSVAMTENALRQIDD